MSSIVVVYNDTHCVEEEEEGGTYMLDYDDVICVIHSAQSTTVWFELRRQ